MDILPSGDNDHLKDGPPKNINTWKVTAENVVLPVTIYMILDTRVFLSILMTHKFVTLAFESSFYLLECQGLFEGFKKMLVTFGEGNDEEVL